MGIVELLAVNFVASLAFGYISSWNYPGGYALQKLHQMETGGSVHIDVAAAMSGISRFLELPDSEWSYSKEENLADFSNFDFLISENTTAREFQVIWSEPGFDHINFKEFPFIQLAPKIHVLKKIKHKFPS